MKVTLLSRPGCHLCDVALAGLEAHLVARHERSDPGSARRIAVEVVDIERDDELLRSYLERIPVILLDGEEVCDLDFDPERLDAAVARRLEAKG